jgi:predicted metal-dependent hydrolase
VTQAHTPQEIDVKLRRMQFGMDGAVPKHWVRGSKFLTHYFNAMSVVFPEGEKFFINAVRQFEDRVTDPKLREQVRGFVAQEGHHTFQHRLMNDAVSHHGLDMAGQDRWIAGFLKKVWDEAGEEERLGITCALEHFTAIMGHQLLVDGAPLQGVDERMAPLWRWHAVEETEHKSVAFDVYKAAGGGYLTRARTLIGATILFFPILHLIQWRLMRQDESETRLSDVLSGLNYLWGRPGFLRRIFGHYFAYLRPSFHPWDLDNRALVEQWKASDEAAYQAG